MEKRLDKKIVNAKWIRFFERKNGKDFYEFGNKLYALGICAYNLNEDFYTIYPFKDKEENYYITVETQSRFKTAYETLLKDIKNIKQECNGFFRANFGSNFIGYKHIKKEIYQFIAINENDNYIYQTFDDIAFFLTQFCFGLWKKNMLKSEIEDSIKQEIINDTFPLLLSARLHQEDYLEYELKYWGGVATQKEMDYLEHIDGKHRFLPTTDIYDIDRFQIENLLKVVPRTFFNKEKCIWFNVYIDGIPQEIVWYPAKHNLIYVRCYPKGFYIKVTDNVVSILNNRYNDETNQPI